MRKFTRFLILALMLSALLCVTAFAGDAVTFAAIAEGAQFVPDGNDKFNVSYSKATANQQYLILMVDMTDDQGNYEIAEKAIQYVNQDAAAGNTVSFTVYPKSMSKSVVLLAGGNEIKVLGHVLPAGVKVSGTVTSYLSGNTTVKLLKDGAEVQTTTVATNSGTYEFNSVPAGTYTLEFSKAGHAPYAEEVVVDSAPITKDVTIYQYGDINGDGEVLPNDKTVLARYLAEWTGYETLPVYDAVADLNCDGEILPNDKTILARFLAEWTGYETLPKE